MKNRTLQVIIAAYTLLCASILAAHGQSLFEKLVMPGDVIEGHAKYEKTCESCHEPFSKTSQRRLCLDCHKDVAADIAGAKGFHGKRRDTTTAECKTCHTDHKGRSADIVQFDAETFNHDFSDFMLEGAHKTVACNGCHAKGKKFRDAPSACIGCHKSDDAHKGALGEQCASCHTVEAWRKPKPFDHAKTKFPLSGAHRDVACAVCHVGERYKDLPRTCHACHKIQDVHAGRYGAKCETCHAPSKWKTISFDHAKSTKFPLKGAHADVSCDRCHKGTLYGQKLATTCVSCHKADDPHKGQLGTRCESCHSEGSWRQKVAFDHDVTNFPLIGLHAAVPCEECHRTTAYRDTPKTCSSCHKDTHHENKLGSNCQRCHNPNGWALWRFNHDRDTKFPLTGAHANLQCQLCHSQPAGAKVTAPTTCYGCHSNDDAHRGAFGRNCDTCH
ncbi:MAG: cytochrome c3 family protein, partial [Hyphomicrobium sp.]